MTYALLSFVTFGKDFLPAPYSEWRLWQFLPDWSLWTWIALFSIFLLCGVLEGAYTEHRVFEEGKQRRIIGVEEPNLLTRKPLTIEAIALAVICFLIFALMWNRSTKPHLRVNGVEIGWDHGSGTVEFASTDSAPADKQWIANIHYQSSVSMKVFILGISGLPQSTPEGDDARSELEDSMWGTLESELKHSKASGTIEVPARTPMFFSIHTEELSQQQLDAISNYKSAVYFMAIFANKYGSPIAGVCIYREGLSPAVQYCHDHNWP